MNHSTKQYEKKRLGPTGTVEMRRLTAQIVRAPELKLPACKDGACSLNWKPYRPETQN